MENSDMIRMANQIAAFFRSYGPEEAKKEIAYHIDHFWEPRMRAQLFSYVDGGGKEVDALVIGAMPQIKRPNTITA